MPFVREIFPVSSIRAGIWHITETAEELLSSVLLTPPETTHYQSFPNESRKRQWLACRALLQHLLDPFPTGIFYDAYGKPVLISGSHHISLSHAGEFAAAVCACNLPVGIDIEKIRDRVERVKERFMVPDELQSVEPEHRLDHLHLYWCGKEALYKLHGKPDIDFKNDIYIHPFDYLCNTNNSFNATINVNGHQNNYTLLYEKRGDYMVVVAL